MKFLLMMCMVLTFTCVRAQNKITQLKIGDKVPDIVLKHVIGANHDLQLSALHKQDLLILNFWATWCVPCIRELPRLDSLAGAYPGKVKVLAVAYEDSAIVKSFLGKHTELQLNHIDMMTNDLVLIEYFKHMGLPHNVWIDQQGIVKYITGAEEVTDAHIASFINHDTMHLHAKIDVTHFDIFGPFHLSDSIFEYRSILTAYIPGLLSGNNTQGAFHHPTERWFSRFFAFNLSREQLLWRAVNGLQSFKNYYGTMEIQTLDSTRFFWPQQNRQSFAHSKYRSNLEWADKNAFCYELSLPEAVKDSDFFAYVLNDLEHIFHVKAINTTQMMPVCVLTTAPGAYFPKAKNDSSYIDLKTNHLRAHDVSVLRLFGYLNQKVKADKNDKPDDPPYVDETRIHSKIDIDVEFAERPKDYAAIKKLIAEKYGFSYTVDERAYPVVLIKDLTP
jgi:thiol-disulfide isomerase/thioredoxin